MAVANSLQMLKTVIMNFSVIKPHFSRRLSRSFFAAGSRLSRICRGRLAGLAEIAAGCRLRRRLGGLDRAITQSEGSRPSNSRIDAYDTLQAADWRET